MESRNVNEKSKKRRIEEVDLEEERFYKFKVLLPNGISVGVTFRDPKAELPVEEFVYVVKTEYMRVRRATDSSVKPKKAVKWSNESIYLVDALDRKIQKKICFNDFKSNKCHIVKLHDGSGAMADTFENMWDLTPATEILTELPEDYTFETSLADLIDNSLQAVWSNGVKEKKLISVEVGEDMISIFDTGPGMDDSGEHSLVNWGKMGASRHRSFKRQAIGGKPPYLVPFFGMFGYGGPFASMHLGRRALVSSKRKESRNVYTLHLEREALLRSSGSEHTWGADGSIKDPSEDDLKKSPHGSYTKVEISGLKMKVMEVSLLQCKLKDIYFPYIQCDEGSSIGAGKTITPVQFEVNGIDLAEVEGGEVATTNLHSCNGPEFVLQLHFSSVENDSSKSQGAGARKEANARIKCVYFPVVEGKENIERILEKLKCDGFEMTESYETFGRVSIRRLGRLLPDARWAQLPFMDSKQKKGDKGRTLKRCCSRVKCFIDTDSGFNPTPSKTDLASHHPYTTALKNLGNKPSEKDKDINVNIYRDGKKVTLLQLEKEYQEWVTKMHNTYDEEIECGTDQPSIILNPNKKKFCVSSDVVRVHKEIERKGKSWKHGQKIKVLKGACDGLQKRNFYATLEYFLLEGFQGDAGGSARVICRPLEVQDENGCILQDNKGDFSLDLRASLSLPISVIDSGMCVRVKSDEWTDQLEKQRQKRPSSIDILSYNCCQELEIDGAFPDDTTLYVTNSPPSEVVAVIRPASFDSSSSQKLDQKYIITESLEMKMDVTFVCETGDHQESLNILSENVTSSPQKGFRGLYRFPLGSKLPDIFLKAGVYIFSFSLRDSSIKTLKRKVAVKVKASSEVKSWGVWSDGNLQSAPSKIKVGECFPPVSIACYDSYGNRIPFPCSPVVAAKLAFKGIQLTRLLNANVDLSPCRMTIKVKDILIESKELDKLRPTYEAILAISSKEAAQLSVSVPCHVTPGPLQHVISLPPNLEDFLKPRSVIKELVLEMFDAYNNHICKGYDVQLSVEGLSYHDETGPWRKVDELGRVDLSGIFRVTARYGENVSLSVIFENNIVFKKDIAIEARVLKLISKLPEFPVVASNLEDLLFEIVDSKGYVAEDFHDDPENGKVHTLTIKTEPMDSDASVRYAFKHGCCTVPSITLPRVEGIFSFVAAHSCHPEICLSLMVEVVKPLQLEHNYDMSYCSYETISLLPEDAAAKYSEDFVASIINKEKKLLDDCNQIASQVEIYEKNLESLDNEETALQRDKQQLQLQLEVSLGVESSQCLYNNCEKEVIMDLITRKEDSAPSLLCNMHLDSVTQNSNLSFTSDIVGVVALLGTVPNKQLSRILAEYLGEDLMLAVVCKSRATADALEKYEKNGNSETGNSLYALATSLGKSIQGRFVVICLEDVRPYEEGLTTDENGKSELPLHPCFGALPVGFLGYAVNLIDIESDRNLVDTESDYSLRETLFYQLFGKLQVYDTLEHLKQASSLKRGGDAVSLDGAIARGMGIISLGHREPEIIFPVVPTQSLTLSQQDRETLGLIEEKKKQIEETHSNKCMILTVYRQTWKKFEKVNRRYTEFMDKNGGLLKGLLEYRPESTNQTDDKLLAGCPAEKYVV